MLVAASLVGAISLAVQPSHITRVVASCSMLLTITRNQAIARMLQTFTVAVSACFSLVASLAVVLLLSALASRDVFGSGPTDDEGTPYFDTYARSLSTMFRLFVGEGWQDILYAASNSTTEAARYQMKGSQRCHCLCISFFRCP